MSDHDPNQDLPSEQEDEFLDDLGDPEHLPPDHILMIPFQRALKTQLLDQLQKVDLNLREKEEGLKDLRREREDVGVQLYGVQQQLAKMQMNYQRTRDNFNIIKKFRQQAEQQLEVLQQQFDKKQADIADQLKKVNKAQDQLNQVNRTIRQVQQYNQQMKSQIGIVKITTYSGEQTIVNLEKEKKMQDVLIDHMNEQIKKLNQQKNLIEAQLKSQKEQTETATQTLKEAAQQLEKIALSKKDLMTDWKDYMRGMQKRDETLQTIQNEIQKQLQQESHLDSELRGYQQLIKQESQNFDKLLQQMEMSKNELQQIHKNLQGFDNQRKYLEQQDRMLKGSKRATQKEISNLDTKKKSIEDQLSVIQKNIMKLHQETHKLMQDIIENISEQTTIEKSENNLTKQAERIRQDASQKEAETEAVRNDIIRVKMDVLHTQQGLQMLRDKKAEIQKELQDKDQLLHQFQKNIRQNHDDLQKKLLYVDRLNRLYANLRKDITDDSSGPYQAKLNHLERTIFQTDTSLSRFEREWISLQTRLVEHQNKIDTINNNTTDTTNKLTILEQRKLRLNNSIGSIQKQRTQVQNSLKSLRNDMSRINILLDTNRKLYKRLQDENRHLEKDFVDKLKELESQTTGLTSTIDQIKNSKQDVLNQIVESERQILLWERKIQLQKEMQLTIDPNIGQKEMQDMKKETHRMELKLDNLRKRQEQLIKEIERAVYKRETIQLKYQPRGQKRKAGASLSKQITNLKNTLRHTTNNTNQIDLSIKEREEELAKIGEDIEQAAGQFRDIESEFMRVNVELASSKLEKISNQWQLNKAQALGACFESVSEGDFVPQGPEDQLLGEFENELQKFQAINSVLEQVAGDHPQYNVLISKLNDWD